MPSDQPSKSGIRKYLEDLPRYQKIIFSAVAILGLLGTGLVAGVRTWDNLFVDRPARMSEFSEQLGEVRDLLGEVNDNILYLYQLRCDDLGIGVTNPSCPLGRPR